MTTTRRAVLRGAAGLATAAWLPFVGAQPRGSQSAEGTARLVMLGTRGGPGVDLGRGETACAVVVDGVPYVLDCGYGTMRALVAAGIGYLPVNTLFFSHLHDDHTADLAALLSHQWTGSKSLPTHVYGPYATERMVRGAIEFFRPNVEIRTVDEGRTVAPETLFFGHDVLDVGIEPKRVFADERIVVSAVVNTHYPERAMARMEHRSLGYRFDTKTRSIAFSGDTAYSANVVRLARGVDIFVCEVMDHAYHADMEARAKQAAAAGNEESIWRHIAETHSTPADVGRMAKEAGAKTVVLNHQVRGPNANGTSFPISAFIDGVRSVFAGAVVVGEDQMVL